MTARCVSTCSTGAAPIPLEQCDETPSSRETPIRRDCRDAARHSGIRHRTGKGRDRRRGCVGRGNGSFDSTACEIEHPLFQFPLFQHRFFPEMIDNARPAL
jgi:hypothetical protein